MVLLLAISGCTAAADPSSGAEGMTLQGLIKIVPQMQGEDLRDLVSANTQLQDPDLAERLVHSSHIYIRDGRIPEALGSILLAREIALQSAATDIETEDRGLRLRQDGG